MPRSGAQCKALVSWLLRERRLLDARWERPIQRFPSDPDRGAFEEFQDETLVVG